MEIDQNFTQEKSCSKLTNKVQAKNYSFKFYFFKFSKKQNPKKWKEKLKKNCEKYKKRRKFYIILIYTHKKKSEIISFIEIFF